eukprot:COSAG05_NODE_8095_length_736_cov_1.682889_2_plen_36_part_01
MDRVYLVSGGCLSRRFAHLLPDCLRGEGHLTRGGGG